MSTLSVNEIQTTLGKPILNSTGSILQVVYANTGFNRQTITSASPTAVTGLSVTITPTSSTSKIIIDGNLRGSYTYVASFTLYRNGSPLISNHGGNSQTGTGPIADYTQYEGTSGANYMHSNSFLFEDSPGSTSPQTYQIYANAGWAGSVQTFYINDRNTSDMLSRSHIRAMEVVA